MGLGRAAGLAPAVGPAGASPAARPPRHIPTKTALAPIPAHLIRTSTGVTPGPGAPTGSRMARGPGVRPGPRARPAARWSSPPMSRTSLVHVRSGLSAAQVVPEAVGPLVGNAIRSAWDGDLR